MIPLNKLSRRFLTEKGFIDKPNKHTLRWIAQCYALGGQIEIDCREFLAQELTQARADFDYQQRKVGNITTQTANTDPVDTGCTTVEYIDSLNLPKDSGLEQVAMGLASGDSQVQIAKDMKVSHQYVTQLVNQLRTSLTPHLPIKRPKRTEGEDYSTCPKCHAHKLMWRKTMRMTPVGYWLCRYCGYKSEETAGRPVWFSQANGDWRRQVNNVNNTQPDTKEGTGGENRHPA